MRAQSELVKSEGCYPVYLDRGGPSGDVDDRGLMIKAMNLMSIGDELEQDPGN